jgi:hypothetical protein
MHSSRVNRATFVSMCFTLLAAVWVVGLWSTHSISGQARDQAANAGVWTIVEAGGEVFKLNTASGSSYYFHKEGRRHASWIPIPTYRETQQRPVHTVSALGALRHTVTGNATTARNSGGESIGMLLKDSFVDPGLGLKPGDIVQKIHNAEIKSLRDYFDWDSTTKSIGEEHWKIQILRDGEQIVLRFNPSADVPLIPERERDD